MAVSNADFSVGQNLIVYTCTGREAQSFTYNRSTKQIEAAQNNLCISLPSGAGGALLELQPCDSSLGNQQWTYRENSSELVNDLFGTCGTCFHTEFTNTFGIRSKRQGHSPLIFSFPFRTVSFRHQLIDISRYLGRSKCGSSYGKLELHWQSEPKMDGKHLCNRSRSHQVGLAQQESLQ